MHSHLIILMGVSGSGKTTIGKMLADALHLPFFDGDTYHPVENVAKMRAGIPLDDTDRYGWLQKLHTLATDLLKQNGGVIACSALKESYRNLLMEGMSHQVKWILLEGEYDLIKSRMQARSEHYMPADLLVSQFATLESPEYAVRVSIDQSPEVIVEHIMGILSKMEIGIVGLGVMGRGLALNFAGKGFVLSLYNRHVAGKEEHIASDFIGAHRELTAAKGFDDITLFAESLQVPRKILLIVEAGNAVDTVLEQLSPLLSTGDVIADCGNSHYTDTERRQEMLAQRAVHYLGVGISGGEKGARYGPSIMPGGNPEGYVLMQKALESIAARDRQNRPCCSYIGKAGAGHFVKMVHNGIEYAEMQLIAEVYGLLRHGYGYDPDRVANLFALWDSGTHHSFLLDITVQILRKREGDGWLLDKISDAARSKGTGGWTLQAANELGVPSPMIAAAVHARFLSGRTAERHRAVTTYHSAGGIHDFHLPTGVSPSAQPFDDVQLADAFYLARLINHHLGFELLREASKLFDWSLDLREIARIWTNGCIIRSTLMESLLDVLPEPLLLHPTFQTQVESMRNALSDLVTTGTSHVLHLPCHGAALNFLNGYTINEPTANLIQAQRDFFGAHGFERIDDASGKSYHF
ncbi:MAG TPA: NADP-dependent phosphogluconate dehydrogenase [Saprospiraceae bacterium]|nr:NADP-dependent phosphogluconate dehydrogenase [Saprospiraceae bacterium]